MPVREPQEYGPSTVISWVKSNLPHADNPFSTQFLALWGGLYLPSVHQEGWRWLTSLVVHENILHLTVNIVAFAALCRALEKKFGFWWVRWHKQLSSDLTNLKVSGWQWVDWGNVTEMLDSLSFFTHKECTKCGVLLQESDDVKRSVRTGRELPHCIRETPMFSLRWNIRSCFWAFGILSSSHVHKHKPDPISCSTDLGFANSLVNWANITFAQDHVSLIVGRGICLWLDNRADIHARMCIRNIGGVCPSSFAHRIDSSVRSASLLRLHYRSLQPWLSKPRHIMSEVGCHPAYKPRSTTQQADKQVWKPKTKIKM